MPIVLTRTHVSTRAMIYVYVTACTSCIFYMYICMHVAISMRCVATYTFPVVVIASYA